MSLTAMGFGIAIELKKDANTEPQFLITFYTDLQINYNFNMKFDHWSFHATFGEVYQSTSYIAHRKGDYSGSQPFWQDQGWESAS